MMAFSKKEFQLFRKHAGPFAMECITCGGKMLVGSDMNYQCDCGNPEPNWKKYNKIYEGILQVNDNYTVF